MIRVLSVIQHAVWGGPHNRNMRIAPLLRARGIHVTVLIPDEAGDAAGRLRNHGVEVIQLPFQRLRGTLRPTVHARHVANFSTEVRSIRRLVRELEIDAVLLNGMGIFQPAAAARQEDVAIVWQLLDVGYPAIVRRLFMPIVVRLADVLMTTGIQVALVHPGAMNFGERLVTFFPPVDIDVFKPNSRIRESARLELGIAPQELVIGTVGNISPQKDHRNFVIAAAGLRRMVPDLRFVILGGTLPNRVQLAERLQQEATAHGLRVGRELIMKNPGQRVCELSQAFDIFWLTSRWEGIPTAIEEAMAMGLPVISTNVGAVHEAVEDQVTGLLVPAADPEALVRATVALIRNPQLRANMSEKARQVAAERFDVNRCADVHAHAFHRAIAYRRARAAAAP